MKNQESFSMAISGQKLEERTADYLPNKQFLDELPLAAYSCDHLGRLNYYNRLAADLWGRKPVLGKELWCGSWKIYQLHGKVMSLSDCPMANAIKGKKQVDKQKIIIERPDGCKKVIMACPKLLYDHDGNVVGAYNILVELSEVYAHSVPEEKNEVKYQVLPKAFNEKLFLNKQSLEKNQERYYKMIEEVQDYAIILLDNDGTILNWNKGAEKIKGYKEKEIIGKHFRIFYPDEDRDNKLPEKLVNIATKEGKATQEGWRKRKDGSRFWAFVVITALHDSNDNVIGFSKVTRDLSHRKANEDQLKLYASNIEIKNKQLEEYAYVASHDLQEPLRKIQVFSELLERNINNKELTKRHLSKINSSAKRMSTLIKDVLRYSQLSKPDELSEKIDLNKVLAMVKEDHDMLIMEKQAEIRISELPLIHGIPIQMNQLFSNLLGNALKFTPQKPLIEISYKLISKNEVRKIAGLQEDSSYHKIDVKDNGPGFEPKYQDQIFKLFKRLDENQQGTGIGLALCQKIVENHKGFISVSSEKDKGSTFSIYLPA